MINQLANMDVNDMMNKLDTLLKKLIPYIILLFIMALVLKYTLNVGIKVQYILIALSTYCFTLLILMVFMRIVASDILRASLRNMFVLYYISLVLCFAGFVYIRYIQPFYVGITDAHRLCN